MTFEDFNYELLRITNKLNAQTRHCAFFEHAGHVDLTEIRVHVNGWDEDRPAADLVCGWYGPQSKVGAARDKDYEPDLMEFKEMIYRIIEIKNM